MWIIAGRSDGLKGHVSGALDGPRRIARIASITQGVAATLPTGGRGPHAVLQTGAHNRLESRTGPAIHLFFDRETAPEDAVFTMKLDAELRAAFMAEAAAEDRPAWQVVRELTRDHIERRREVEAGGASGAAGRG